MPDPNMLPENTYIVGIGSSAGGLESLIPLVRALPKNLNCTIVIIQHLSPNYRSMMAELLGRETDMTVSQLEDGLEPRLGHIYIAPPKWDVIFQNNRFSLLEPVSKITAKPSANRFLNSLAIEKEEFAISVIMSGTGTDGAAGSRSIKANGGMTFAQTPESAKYSGMPSAAIAEGVIDRILDPREIAEDIVQLVTLGNIPTPVFQAETQEEQLKRLFQMVRLQTKIDFSGYKRKTIWRRILRRMVANRIQRFDDYLQFVTQDTAELEALSKHILISVTAFFRDPDVFTELKNELKKTLERKSPGDEIRIWIPGCATGEEAYTIAIIIDQLLGEEIKQYLVQIFATDIDLDAIEVARRGNYPSTALEDMPSELVHKYFTQVGNDFNVVKELRDLIVFARQDLVLDPPFLRLDLVSCRNLLIYFDVDLQKKVLEIINYSLQDGGLLLLGRSESITQQESMFLVSNNSLKLFSSISSNHKREIATKPFPTRPVIDEDDILPRPAAMPKSSYEDIFSQIVQQNFIPPSVLVNSRKRILRVQGNVSDYIRFVDGRPNLDVNNLLDSSLTSEYTSMLQTALRKNKTVRGRRRRIKPGAKGMVQMMVCPTSEPSEDQGLHLLAFLPVQARKSRSRGGSDINVRELEDELNFTKEHLQTFTEELETSNEELQALNEEVQASNEELQASNEELEASNEELQATNEEMVTVNEEMIIKNSEMSVLTADFAAVQNSLDFPMLVLDANNRVTRLNNAANALLGRQIPPPGHDFHELKFDDDAGINMDMLQQVRSTGTLLVRDITLNKREYQLHLQPVINALGQSQGIIISLVDQHDLISSEKEAKRNHNFLMAIMDNAITQITVKDLSGRYQFANRAFLNFFKLSAIEGKRDNTLLPEEIANLFRHREVLVLEKQQPQLSEDEFSWDNQHRLMETITFPLLDEEGVIYAIGSQSRDITVEKQSRDQLSLAAKVFDRAAEGIMVTDGDNHIVSVNHAFSHVTGFSAEDVIGKSPSLLSSGKQDARFYQQMWQQINELGWWQGEIWNKRKDGEIYSQWLTISRINNDDGEILNYLAIFSDITNLKDSRLKAEYLATHDELTGLANRMLFKDRFKHALQRATRSETHLFVLFCDLDNFKVINDTLGHGIGDQLLKQTAHRLIKSVRQGDTVARLGGDEFIVLLEEAEISTVEQISMRIIEYLSATFETEDHKLNISCSIGISQYPEDGNDIDTLLKNADIALYRSKDQGKNTFTFFSGELRYESQRLLAVQMGLRLALQTNNLQLVYQPVIAQNDSAPVLLEALLRWPSDDFGHMSMREVISIAEECGIIHMIDDWVLQQVLSDIHSCIEAGTLLPLVAINLSVGFFSRADCVKILQQHLAEKQLGFDRLALEFSESNINLSNTTFMENLQQLADAGCQLALDDFGSTTGSITLLRSLPIKMLKIDNAITTAMTDNSSSQQLVEALIKLGQAFNIDVIAKGVENSQQHELLSQLACPLQQGCYYQQPAPLTDLIEQVEKNDG